MINIFIGYDSKEKIAYHVLSESILRHSTKPVAITPVYLPNIKNDFVRKKNVLKPPPGIRGHGRDGAAARGDGAAAQGRAGAGDLCLGRAGGHRHPVGRHHPGHHDHPVHRLGDARCV